MSENERDSHFAGFAKLLLDEIKKKYAWVEPFQGEGSEMGDLYRLIARRAYDLACHVIYETSYGLDRFYIPERINENVPDLTEWPK